MGLKALSKKYKKHFNEIIFEHLGFGILSLAPQDVSASEYLSIFSLYFKICGYLMAPATSQADDIKLFQRTQTF